MMAVLNLRILLCRSFVTPGSRYCYVAKVVYLALSCARSWRSVRQAYLCTYKALANEKKSTCLYIFPSVRVCTRWTHMSNSHVHNNTHFSPPLNRPSHYAFTGFKTWQVPTEKRWTQGFYCKKRVFRTSDMLNFFECIMLNSPPTVIIDRQSIAARKCDCTCGNSMHLFFAVCVAENICFTKVKVVACIHAAWCHERRLYVIVHYSCWVVLNLCSERPRSLPCVVAGAVLACTGGCRWPRTAHPDGIGPWFSSVGGARFLMDDGQLKHCMASPSPVKT